MLFFVALHPITCVWVAHG